MGATLTTNNFESFMEEIPWEMVPKTIQDAALTTRRLAIDYLWVDSLCIIQDSPDDKTLEISQMTEVYTHATLTIMAKRANDAQDGFLHKRLLPSGTSNMSFRYRNGEEGIVTLSFESALSDEFGTRLDTRGWVLQEYLLSRRLLIIGNWATEWSCRQERYSPGNVDGWTRETKKETDPFKYNESGRREKTDTVPEIGHTLDAVAFFAAHPSIVPPKPGEWPVHQTWNGLVESFTDRYLSEPTDRIRAIAGLAKNFSVMYESQYGSKYAAGLWCQDLPGAVLWRNCDRQTLPRPAKWQGPSWSWVSISNRVQCNFARKSACTEVEYVNCELVSPEAPFGELREAGTVLRMRGCAIELDWRYTSPKKPKKKFGTDGSDIRYLNSDHIYVDAKVDHYLDAREPATDWTRITLLLIDPGTFSNAEGIILKKTHGGKHSRLGYFEIDYNGDTKGFNSPLPFPRSWEKQVFEIV
ncbi:het-domain protein [Fusarium sp. NRRL 52700]|nr:het-domain protein [Fusarium sp. NRRL 52700]